MSIVSFTNEYKYHVTRLEWYFLSMKTFIINNIKIVKDLAYECCFLSIYNSLFTIETWGDHPSMILRFRRGERSGTHRRRVNWRQMSRGAQNLCTKALRGGGSKNCNALDRPLINRRSPSKTQLQLWPYTDNRRPDKSTISDEPSCVTIELRHRTAKTNPCFMYEGKVGKERNSVIFKTSLWI